jgi:transporter family protein
LAEKSKSRKGLSVTTVEEATMHSWVFGTLLAMVTFGAWGFFPKLAGNYISPQSALIYQVIGGLVVGIVGLAIRNFKPETHPMGIVYAFLTGITGFFGTFFYYAPASKG